MRLALPSGLEHRNPALDNHCPARRHKGAVQSRSGYALPLRAPARPSGEFADDVAEHVTADVLHALAKRFALAPPAIEDIQDEVEWALMRAGQFRAARAYIIYRAQHTKLRHDRYAAVDAVTSINEYLERLDWRVQANANQGYSLGWFDPEQRRQADCQLLAQQCLSGGNRRRRIEKAQFTSTIWIC